LVVMIRNPFWIFTSNSFMSHSISIIRFIQYVLRGFPILCLVHSLVAFVLLS
jgi:hypothetical protein